MFDPTSPEITRLVDRALRGASVHLRPDCRSAMVSVRNEVDAALRAMRDDERRPVMELTLREEVARMIG